MNNPFYINRTSAVSKKVTDNKKFFYKECYKKKPGLNRINYILRSIDKKNPHMLRLMQAEYKCDIETKWIETASVMITFMIFELGMLMNNNKKFSDAVGVLYAFVVVILLLWTINLARQKQEQASYALHWINLYLKYGYVPDRDYDIEEEQEIRKYRKGDQAEKMHPYQESEEEQE